ncbi:MAG TPA: DUF4301 family protein, partial [Thermoanaerobaculia bacterium]|nr:DUF4301 family protein [Thermoanaerobaculia bacterium]
MTEPGLFSERDLDQMERLGITPEEALRHVELFRNPPPYTRVLRPCTLGDGIRAIFPGDEPELTARFDEAAAAGRIHKLVPASGAASRMFKPLLEYLDQLEGAAGTAGGPEGGGVPADFAGTAGAAGTAGTAGGPIAASSPEAQTFFAELPRFAFFEELAAAAAAQGVHLGSGTGPGTGAGSRSLAPAEQRIVLACLLTA